MKKENQEKDSETFATIGIMGVMVMLIIVGIIQWLDG
jgi:hypothetical protein